MNRRTFIKTGLAALGASVGSGCVSSSPDEGTYSISILGDTHFDAAPQSLYHGHWVPRDQNDRRDRQGEFARNADMWANRLPKLIAAAAKTRRDDTRFLLQMGDLVQGDCTDEAIQLKMLEDARSACTRGFGDLPFLTVCGNHDIRSGGSSAYDAFLRSVVRRAIGQTATSANFFFRQGPDAYVFVDFMRPDNALIHAMLDVSEDARHTFFVLHSPIAPSDTWGSYWFLFGKPGDEERRRTLFARLVKRRAIVLCGHLHRTQIRRWRRYGGELVEFSMNSVWRPQENRPRVLFSSPSQFGDYVKRHPAPMGEDHDGCRQKRTAAEQVALMDEYRSGLVQYRMLEAAGHYQLRVSDKGVSVGFYACDATSPFETFALKG